MKRIQHSLLYFFKVATYPAKKKSTTSILSCSFFQSILFIVFLLSFLNSNANTYYVATNGNNNNPGTINSPFATWEHLTNVLVAGDIAYIRGGTYRAAKPASADVRCRLSNLNGTATDSIKIFAYPGENPILNLDDVLVTVWGGYGLYLENSKYVWIKGLRVTGMAQNNSGNVIFGFTLANSNNCRIEFCEVDNIGGQGFYSLNSNDILYKNCDAHHLDDRYSAYPWNGSNGFGASSGGNTSTRNTYDGCRAWWISDDGWDFFACDGFFTIKNCWSFWNGYEPGTFTPRGDGAGYKLGPTSNKSTTLLRVLTNNLSVENRAFGFDQNGGNCIYNLHNNTAFNNGDIGFIWGYFPSIPQVFKNNISHNNNTNYAGTEITGDHNSWNPGVTLNNADFQSISSTGLNGPRQADGSLPNIPFLHLDANSDLIDKGINVGLPFSGSAPDIGSYEHNSGNQSPTANAGANQNITLPVNTVTLNGSGTDPDGTISAYQWTKISGPAATIVSPAQASTVINSLVQGVYQFELRVTDNQGAIGTATVTVMVNAAVANQPPSANAGINQNITLPVNTVTLNGSGTDPDGTIAAYQWTKINGPAAIIVSPTQASTVINSLVQGVYQFELRVTDNQGAIGTATVTVTVNAAVGNQAPTANAGANQNITLPVNTVTLNGSGTDPDGTIAAYQWTKISGPAATIVSPAQASTVINSLVQGVYQFELRVTDNQGAIGTATVTVTVNAAVANQPPTANAGANQNITLPVNTVTLNGSGTDPDGTIAAYQWTKISGPAATIVSPTQASTVINSLVQGVYQFELRVTDNQGAIGTATVTVTVNATANQPPTANAGINQNITLPVNSLTLTGSGTDPDGTITAYQWTKISGPAATIVSPAQASTVINSLVQGVYQFELRVTDNQGAIGAATVIVTVNGAAANQAPTANAGANQNITLPVNSLTLNGSGTDPDGTIVAYQWIKINGPAATIVSPTQASTVINALVQGVYQFELRVTDNQGAIGTATVTVTVNAAVGNQAPTANAGSDQNITLPVNSLTLSGSGTDPDGTISVYSWTKVSGPSQFNISSSANAQTIINNLAEGVYEFQLEVTDNAGAKASDRVTVTVRAAQSNNRPTSRAGKKKTVTLPNNRVMLEGSGIDTDGTITAYSWRVLSSPVTVSFTNSQSATTEVSDLTAAGIYRFELEVIDDMGASATDTVEVEVTEILTPAATIYPNPVMDVMNLKIDLPKNSGSAIVYIYDMQGRIMYQKSVQMNQSSVLMQIDVSQFNGGTYIVKVNSDGNSAPSIKMIKQ